MDELPYFAFPGDDYLHIFEYETIHNYLQKSQHVPDFRPRMQPVAKSSGDRILTAGNMSGPKKKANMIQKYASKPSTK